MLRSTQNSQQEIISLRNASLKQANEMNSAAKISYNNKKEKKKEEKKNKKKKNAQKKKRSGLAFWFCMGNKTDNLDKDRQPFPAQKDKDKAKNKDKNKGKDKSPKENKKQKCSNNDQKKNSQEDAKNRKFEGKKRQRFSAPPTDWISMVATLENQNKTMTNSGSGAKQDSNPVADSSKMSPVGDRSRSKSPGGVRYRFDGTLEKPYVYPGGLTFNSMRTPKSKGNKSKKWNRRSSKKKGNVPGDNSVVEAEIHHTDDDEDDDDEDDDEDDDDSGGEEYYYYDESDVRRQFYLRYDSHMKKKPSKKDRRYSIPAELQRRVEMETDVLGAMYGRGASRWIDGHPKSRTTIAPNTTPNNNSRRPLEELYDEPYEGSDNDEDEDGDRGEKGKRASHLMAHSRPSSYYQSPPAIQNSDCVYMWHSCEDIPKCEVEYHSEEEVRSSMECMPAHSNDDQTTATVVASPPRCHSNESKQDRVGLDKSTRGALLTRDCSGLPSEVRVRGDAPRIDDSKNKVISSSPIRDHNISSIDNNNITASSHSSTPPCNSHTQNVQQVKNISHHVPNLLHHESFNNTSLDISDDVFSNSVDNAGIGQQCEAQSSPMSKNLKDHFVKSPARPFDNPFRRNVGRSSCMPGNKRFFVPPPPTYTPPREEFELALGKMAAEENDRKKKKEKEEEGETKPERMGDRWRHHRGSQTDLTGESNDEDTLDMVEREKQAAQERLKDEHALKTNYTPSESQTGVEECSYSPRDKTNNAPLKQRDNENVYNNVVEISSSKTPSLRDDTGKSSENAIMKTSQKPTPSSSPSSSSEDDDSSEEDKILYINCPQLRKPPSSSTSSSRHSSRRHTTVVTSTPKAKRRSDLSFVSSTSTTGSTSTSTVTLRTPKRPVPTPRQRFSSCLEYSTIKIPSPSSTSLPLSQQQQQQQQPIQREELISQKSPVQNSVSLPVTAIPKPRPVAKKRLSQMVSSDSSYSHADIEEGLKVVDEEYYLPSKSFTNKNGSTRKELFPNNTKSKSDKDDDIIKTELTPHKPSSSISNKTSSSSSSARTPREEDRDHQPGSTIHNLDHSTTSSSSMGGSDDLHRNHFVHEDRITIKRKNNNANANESDNDSNALPPLEKFQLSKSPTAARRHFSSVFSSSVECLSSHLSKSYYYSGLSSSLADIPSQLGHTPPTSRRRRVLSMFPYGADDDNDDENADDEMSVHNEESPLPKTPSLEDLLRARSILDRSQAVCRKRRQRLRERKCRSQILSSTEVDNYITKEHGGIRQNRTSRHSSKKKDFSASTNNNNNNSNNNNNNSSNNNNNNNSNIKNNNNNDQPANATTQTNNSLIHNNNNATTTNHIQRNAFSFDHEIASSIPAQSRRFLYRQHRLLNHTDSGMDSDGASSPFNSRDFHIPVPILREGNNDATLPKPQNGVSSPLDVVNITADIRVRGGSVDDRESWDGGRRKYDRRNSGELLNTKRPKEFLTHSRNSHHLDGSVSVSNGFETLV